MFISPNYRDNFAEKEGLDMILIPLIDCVDLPKEINDYLLDEHEYGCHYDHTVLQIENDGNLFAEWLKFKGYKFQSNPDGYPSFDLIALYGT